jgi:hypothetical protein
MTEDNTATTRDLFEETEGEGVEERGNNRVEMFSLVGDARFSVH